MPGGLSVMSQDSQILSVGRFVIIASSSARVLDLDIPILPSSIGDGLFKERILIFALALDRLRNRPLAQSCLPGFPKDLHLSSSSARSRL